MKRYYGYNIKEAYTLTELENSDFYRIHNFRVDGREEVEYVHKDLVQALLDNGTIKPLEVEN